MTTSRNLAVDRIRREATLRAKLPLLVMDDDAGDPAGAGTDLLRLVLTCCHPALGRAAQLALTLRLLGGLTVPEIAAGLLLKEATVAARVTRAKQKIAAAGVPFRVPPDAELPRRLGVVLEVVHLVHTAGHTALEGPGEVGPGEDGPGRGLTRPDLSTKARDLARMLCRLLPGDPEVHGLLGLCLLTDSRAPARVGPDGEMLLLAAQDRDQWDADLLQEGLEHATRALQGGTGRFALMAGIAGLHARAVTWETTDWPSIALLYDGLAAVWPTPVVSLNRWAARSLLPDADLPAVLDALDELEAEPSLQGYPYLPATRADVLRRLGRPAEAARSYERAVRHARNRTEAGFLRARVQEMARLAAGD